MVLILFTPILYPIALEAGIDPIHVGVVMVVHDLNLAARCADQMVLMQCSRVVVSGAPPVIGAMPTFHSPSMGSR